MEEDTVGTQTYRANSCPHWQSCCTQCVAQQAIVCIQGQQDVTCPQGCGKALWYTDMRNLLRDNIISNSLFDMHQAQKRAMNLNSSPDANWIWYALPLDCSPSVIPSAGVLPPIAENP